MAKTGEQIELTVGGISSEGAGVGRYQGLAVFVPGALPGETVRVELTERKKNFARARLLEVLDAAPARVDPPCAQAGSCGGCALQQASYGAQLEMKRQMVEQTLRRIGKLDAPVLPAIGAENPWHYRSRAVLHVAQDESGFDLGYYQAASHMLVRADDCLLLAQPLLDLIKALREILPAFAAQLAGLRELSLRCSADGQRLLLSFITEQSVAALEPVAARLLEAEPRLVSLWECSGPAVYGVYGESWRKLWGEDYLCDKLAGVELEVAPAAFTQVNAEQTARLYALAGEAAALQAGDMLLDVYCGLGALGLALCGPQQRLIGVESYAPAVEAARRNAARRQAEADFFCGAAESVLPRLAAQGLRPQVVTLDPPRAGCAAAALAAVAELQPQRIVYVSCDPATLARDLRQLNACGYGVRSVQPLDMFCHTAHIETVAVLDRV